MNGKNMGEEGKEEPGDLDPVAKAFGRYLRDLRKSKSLSQKELAEEIEVSHGYAGFFEQGRQIPSKKIIRRLARALGVDYLEMLQRADHEITEDDLKKKEWLDDFADSSVPDDEAAGSAESGTSSRVDGQALDEGATGGSDSVEGISTQNTQLPGIRREHYIPVGSSSQAQGGEQGISSERLDWALECIARDPTYPLPAPYKSGTHPDAVKALLIRLYQAETRRSLLTPEEVEALNHVV